MAQHQVIITYPDAKAADLLAALRRKYGQVLDGGVYRDRTPAECKFEFDSECRSLLTAIYKDYKRSEQAVQDLEATV